MARLTATFQGAVTRSLLRGRSAEQPRPWAAHGSVSRADGRRNAGWFESSWDLKRGLEVQDSLTDEAQIFALIESLLRDEGDSGSGTSDA